MVSIKISRGKFPRPGPDTSALRMLGRLTAVKFKTYKSLEAYNFMVSGFIMSIQGCIVSGKHVAAGKVRHA